jgi:hypothetical protein
VLRPLLVDAFNEFQELGREWRELVRYLERLSGMRRKHSLRKPATPPHWVKRDQLRTGPDRRLTCKMHGTHAS